MSATDELRKLLEERGVAWDNVDNDGDASDYYTEWHSDDNAIKMTAEEYSWSYGKLTVTAMSKLSPCQAAAMIDLRGKCKFEINDNSNNNDGMQYDIWFECSACHARFDYIADEWLMYENYCPACGRKVEK